VARGATFLALALFGALHWMTLLEPPAAGRAWLVVGAAVLVTAGLLLAGRLRGALRALLAVATALVGAALALLAGGIADELLRPDRWDQLASGIARGIEAVPGARVPYRGVDEWTRTVIPLGGSALTVAAALLAFWPRRRRTGFPLLALVLLVSLYAVPAIALDFGGEFVRGALLTLLVVAFLRLEKLRVRDAQPAAVLTGALAVLALALAPILDRGEPWWDYEAWALETAAAKTTAFAWDHRYGPLNWPRDGREVLRVRARQPAYWKASNLDAFDGQRWIELPLARPQTTASQLPFDRRMVARHIQRIRVNVRNLRSETFITAGTALSVEARRVFEFQTGVPTIFRAGRPLRRGDVYEAVVYTPEGVEDEVLRAAPTRSDFASFARFLTLGLPNAGGMRNDRIGEPVVTYFPDWEAQRRGVEPFASPGASGSASEPATPLLEEGPYARSWELARELASGVATPFGYVRAVERHLARGFAYTEEPPAEASTLDGFLFDAQAGYCQQFSGAMAMLLRMAGIPARVATGFTSGSRDEDTGEYVVRDLDAHSWVEVWFPGVGWVSRDPTPAAAPPRSQTTDAAAPTGAAAQRAPDLGTQRQADVTTRALAPEERTDWVEVGALGSSGALGVALIAVGLIRSRRRGPLDPLAELERALRRVGADPGPGATLQALEARFRRSPAAAGYLAALREQRYGTRPRTPTPAERRGLRAELGRGRGLRGRVRAWWALPPRRPPRRS